MIITATFIGKNSLGYENGKTYKLKTLPMTAITISRIDGTGECVYESINAFFKNWKDIKQIN